jgi:hypothetical protein
MRIDKKGDDAIRRAHHKRINRIKELELAIGKIRVLASGQATMAERNILQIANKVK